MDDSLFLKIDQRGITSVRHVDVAITGNDRAGRLLSTLVYLKRKGLTDNHNGETGFIYARTDFESLCYLTATQFDLASKRLSDIGLIKKRVIHTGERKMIFIQMKMDKYTSMVESYLNGN